MRRAGRPGPTRIAGLALLALACAGGGTAGGPTDLVDPPSAPPPSSCDAARDTAKVPLTDLGAGCYRGFQGGLYASGTNVLPAAHLASGLSAAARVQPLDTAGRPSAGGKYVLLSIGMSNTTQEFCSAGGAAGSCEPWSFIGQAAADAAVDRSTLVIANGAAGGRTASAWVSASSAEYDRIRDQVLRPQGLAERQVQIAWVKVANAQPSRALPDTTADARVLERQLGQILRALKARYPNLQQVFLSSRLYAGYATTQLNPEPYAYESGFAVKWVVAAQIDEMAGGAASPRAGRLRIDDGTAPWVAWGPYPWAAGTRARSDGLFWLPTDFAADGTHPATGGRQKVGTMLLDFFKTSAVTRCWFLAGQRCG